MDVVYQPIAKQEVGILASSILPSSVGLVVEVEYSF